MQLAKVVKTRERKGIFLLSPLADAIEYNVLNRTQGT